MPSRNIDKKRTNLGISVSQSAGVKVIAEKKIKKNLKAREIQVLKELRKLKKKKKNSKAQSTKQKKNRERQLKIYLYIANKIFHKELNAKLTKEINFYKLQDRKQESFKTGFDELINL